jgi:hypothetical protein
MPKVQPPELRKFMDKKISSAFFFARLRFAETAAAHGAMRRCFLFRTHALID